MPTTCETYLSQIDSAYANADNWYDIGHVHEQWILNNSLSSFNQTYRDHIIGFVGAVDAMLQSLIHCNPSYTTPLRIPYYLRNCVGGAELDMDAILQAIWNSDKLRWFHFINYIDSMRAGIWNVEIYETHLADWYRHFSI